MTTTPFDRVPFPLRRALQGRGFTELTRVQLAALDAIDAGRDLRISSQTGSGKTVAVGLALAPELIARAESRAAPGPDALIVTPTRELAVQVHNELDWLFAEVQGLRIDSVTGGTNVGQERRRLRRRPRILVGTPGRLCDHIRSKALDCSDVRQLVLDEADQMLDMGFREDLEAILAAMPGRDRRTHMLSATFPPAVQKLTEDFQNDPLHVEGTRLGAANEDIAHVAHAVQPRDRYPAIVNLLLLRGDQRTLIFVATRAGAAKLADKLAGDGFSTLPLSGELAQTQRTRTLNAFRAGTVSVLVATDVAARGLDIPDVQTVIHGDLPFDGESYTHRSGRTGRAGRKGCSVLLATAHGQRRARQILDDANVSASWEPVPNAAEIEKALGKRARRRMRKALSETKRKVTDGELEFAKSLLEGRDPAQVLAEVIAGVPSDRVREPFEVQASELRSRRNGRQPGPESAQARRSANAGYTRFHINWGHRHGANPKRLLAAICRRGDVSGKQVGAIEIAAFFTTFDIADSVAEKFERQAARRDDRDPTQRISRYRPPEGRRHRHRPTRQASVG